MVRVKIPEADSVIQIRLSSGLKKAIQNFGVKHGGLDVSSIIRGFIIDGMIRYANADEDTIQKMIRTSFFNEEAEGRRVLARKLELEPGAIAISGNESTDELWEKQNKIWEQNVRKYIEKYGDTEIIREYEFIDIHGLHKEEQK